MLNNENEGQAKMDDNNNNSSSILKKEAISFTQKLERRGVVGNRLDFVYNLFSVNNFLFALNLL